LEADDRAVAAVVPGGSRKSTAARQQQGQVVRGMQNRHNSRIMQFSDRQSIRQSSNRQSAMQRLAIVALLAASLTLPGCSYNRFVSQEEAVKAQWAQVQNQLQRRNDLIPNLVETVKGYASHEKEVFQQIADSRARLSGAQTPAETISAANQQSAALARLLVIVENYPNLKANEQFNRLSDELSGTENRIAVERMRYNERVQEYNTSRRQFPGIITAKVFSFQDYPLFEAPQSAQQVPKVSF
jgi:LemA protein